MQSLSSELESLSYENAYAELEEIVSGLETNSKTLEEALALYERGQALAEHCANLLEQAELRVRQLSEHDAPGMFADQDEDLEI
jgi:exodeoxyribonuclease VII small subunit